MFTLNDKVIMSVDGVAQDGPLRGEIGTVISDYNPDFQAYAVRWDTSGIVEIVHADELVDATV